MVDGNLEALRLEENRQRKQEEAWEIILAEIRPLLVEIEELSIEIHNYDDFVDGYDFSEDIDIEISNII